MKKAIQHKDQLKIANKYKRKAIDLYNLTKDEDIFTDKQSDRIKNCGYWIQLKYTEDFSKSKINKGYFCGNRFCPFCSYGKSLKSAITITTMINYLTELKYQFVYLTLTVPNCVGSELNAEINNINKAWDSFKRRVWFKNNFHGFIKKLEVTKNIDEDTYHPHLHILLAVKPTYFFNPVKPEQIIKTWKTCTKRAVETQSQNIKKFRNTYGNVMEIAIYQSKPNEFLHDVDTFKDFYYALKGKQIINFNGVFNEANQLIKKKQMPDKYFPADDTIYKYIREFRWNTGYKEISTREITEEDIMQEHGFYNITNFEEY